MSKKPATESTVAQGRRKYETLVHTLLNRSNTLSVTFSPFFPTQGQYRGERHLSARKYHPEEGKEHKTGENLPQTPLKAGLNPPFLPKTRLFLLSR